MSNVELPLSIFPKPDVIEPAFKAPLVVKLANVVIAVCVPPVTVAAVPVALPVKVPVIFPANAVVVSVPELGL